MKVYDFPAQAEQAYQSQMAGEEYLLTGKCTVCNQPIVIQESIYGFEPRCWAHEEIKDLEHVIALIDVRTAPFEGKIIVDPNLTMHGNYRIGEEVPNTPGWIFLGVAMNVFQMQGESASECYARAKREAGAWASDYQPVEY